MRIAVIGLGQMGRSFASRALQGGHAVTVWNRSPGRAEALVAEGAVAADSPAAAVRDVDVVLLILADDAAVLNVCLGEAGILGSLGPSTVLATVSTVAPDTVRRLADLGPEGRVLDAPVMGSPDAVASGHCRFLVGGPLPAITSLDPLWHDLSDGYVHCGAVGNAAIMKLVSNLLLITGITSLAEAIATARGNGIPDELLQQVLGNSPVVSAASAVRLPNLLDENHPGWFPPELARKDLRLAVALAETTGVKVRVGPATDELLKAVAEGGHQWPDFSAVIEALA
jgi:3-hydroxyisobutyrate dehydrogenase-like beta-hydroxyacid dehydrogenase